jgi:hypothetical protein
MPAGSAPEQHRGAGSQSRKAAGAGESGVPSISLARRTLPEIEKMNMIRKGQVRWLSKNDIAGQSAFIERLVRLPPRER